MLEQFFDNDIDEKPVVKKVNTKTKKTVVKKTITETKIEPVEVKTPSIQDRTKERTRELIGEVEGLFDTYISDWKEKKNYAFLFNIGIKPMHARTIIIFCQGKINEYNVAMSSKDDQVKEAYSCYTKPQMKKIVLWWQSIIVDCHRLIDDGKRLSRMKREKNARKKGLDIRKRV